MTERFIDDPRSFTWLDLTDPESSELSYISREYGLHEYTLQDCLQPDHLPKHETMGATHFLITRMLSGITMPTADSIQEMSNKVAIFYNEKLIITIHRRQEDFLYAIRDGLQAENRETSTGDIVTRILWHVLDSYEKPGIQLSGKIDHLESVIFLQRLSSVMLKDFYYIKRKASVCHKLLLLSGEAVNSVKFANGVALQDLKDLHVKLLNVYGQVHEDVSNLLSMYLSISAGKTNDVMKVLTLFSAFFLPITFLAGVYGMNFRYMPELELPFGYPMALLLMALVCGIIGVWFKRKKWL